MLKDMKRLEADKKGVAIRVVKKPSSSQLLSEANVHVDPTKIGIVFRNLLANALKFTPQAVCITISLSVVDEDAVAKMIKREGSHRQKLKRPKKSLRGTSWCGVLRRGRYKTRARHA